MKFRLALAGLLVAASSTSAFASGPYIGAALGVSVFHDSELHTGGTGEIEYEVGAALGASIGYDFDGFRLEGEYGIKGADIDTFRGHDAQGSMDSTVTGYMVNGFFDLKTLGSFTPYVGAGIGKLRVRATDAYGAYKDQVFGYQLSGGASIAVGEHVSVDLSYRYQTAAEDFRIGVYDVSYSSSNLMAGLRYTF